MTSFNTFKSHIYRSPIQTVTSLVVIIISSFLYAGYLVLNNGANNVLTYFSSKPEITIFLKDNLNKDTVTQVKNELSSRQGITRIDFISKERALEIYKEQNKDKPMLLEMVTADILPASFEISATDPEILNDIYNSYVSRKDIVDEIIFQKELVKNLEIWISRARLYLLSFILIKDIETLFVITAIIGMKTVSRKDEIQISRSLGANQLFILKPFLYEGLFYGIAGSLIGSALAFGLFYYFKPAIDLTFNIEFISANYRFYLISLGSIILRYSITCILAAFWGAKRHIRY